MRVLGLLLYTHGDAVGLGVPRDYLDPWLPGVEPLGVPPQALVSTVPQRSFAPLELADEPAPLANVAVAAPAARPRVTQLDPSKLPPLPKAED